MKRITLLAAMLLLFVQTGFAQRITDKLDRGLVAMKTGTGVYLSWRVLAEEYYDVTYNVYRDGTKLNDEPLSVSNYRDTEGTAANSYTVRAVVRGAEQTDSKVATPWVSSYKEIKLTHEGIKSTLVPNDVCCADVDGDGELEILMKFDNLSEMEQAYPKMGPTIDGTATGEYSIFECLKQDGTRLWWVNCGPNMGDFQNNEQNIVAYDWDGDGKAEAVMRAADGTVIHMANGETYTVGNKSTNVRGATGGGTNWFVTTDGEYLLYLNGETGEPYQCISYPLKRLENGETDLNAAWGDGYGHRCSKHFFGAPYLDGRKPSIFLARGIYTRHKMIAYDVDPSTHKLNVRWTWYNNTNGPWKGQGYHNFCIADVDWDGRDEIVFGSMVIDDNGKGLSTTGLGHGDSQHCSDFNPYIHGQEIYACLEDNPGNNYRDATTSKIYHRMVAGNDDGRAICGNFTNTFPGGLGCSAREGAISTITNEAVSGMEATGVNTNFRIYWDGDLCSETFNYLNGKNTEGCVAKYGSWTPIYTMAGSLTNNDTKGTPCYQGDILGDWREEVIMRTADNNIRIYSTPSKTNFRIPTLWSDHQYRNAMVWQMCGYNQTPHISYYLGELEGITQAPPPLTMTGRTEVANGGSITSALDGQHVIVCETGNSSVTLTDGSKPYILTFNVPTWVQGSAASESTNQNAKITYTTYTCNVSGGGLAGEARLVKQGDGILNLPKADFKHSGETNIWAGVLNFDGTMKQSPLWLNRFAELNSDGGEFQSIKADYGSIIRPGGADKKGTLTTASLSLGFGSRLVFDLYSEGIIADVIKTGNLSIEQKTSTAWVAAGPQYLSPVIELVGHLATGETKMAAGKYVLAEITGDITGNVDAIVVEGLSTDKKKLYVEEGKLILEIQGMREATTVTWTGENGSDWNLAETVNFVPSGAIESDYFVSGDDVVFDDNAALKTVNITESVMPKSVTVNNTAAYTFKGDGGIDGTATFTKEGKGTVTMSNSNSYTGGNYLKGGTVKVSQLANQYNELGNLGGITKGGDKFTLENGAVLQTTAATRCGSPMKMVGEEGGCINNSADLNMDASLSGTVLTKKGAGCLFTGSSSLQRLIITAGSVAETSNPAATVEFQGGTLYDDGQCTSHAIYVPKGKTGTWHLSYNYYTAYNNKITGEGTLTIIPRNTVSRVRITGDWSLFEGTIKHTNTNIWLPLDATSGMPHGTLDIASGCTVTNVAKAFAIGAVTGSGSLAQPVANFLNSNAVSGDNTWNIGNSDDNNFTFAGIITDNNSSNKVLFNKVGTCKMTFTGKGDFQGACRVNGGELCLSSSNTNIMLGRSTLYVAKGATLSGKGTLGNTTTTVATGATLRVGTTATNAGTLEFGGGNLTVNGTVQAYIGSQFQNGKFTGIGTLKLNGTFTLKGRATLALTEGTEIKIFEAETIEIGQNVKYELCEPNATLGLTWDTSRLSEGILVVGPAPDGIMSLKSDELKNAEIYTLGGIKLNRRPTHNGIYIVNGKKINLK